MSLSNGTSTFLLSGFTATDDLAFEQLVHAQALRASNPLINVKPSTLNFTSNLWTTNDLSYVTYNSSGLEETARLGLIANALTPALPANATVASILDLNEYWQAIVQLNTTQYILPFIPLFPQDLPALNFSANCSATNNFWANIIYPNKLYSTDDPSWGPFIRSSLDPPFSQMSDWIVRHMSDSLFMALTTLDGAPSGLLDTLNTAAATCSQQACQSLGYSGNSDIAGSGSVAVYGFVATNATILILMVIYISLKKHDGLETFYNKAEEGTFAFWDTVVWVGLFATVAGWVYVEVSAKTVYEYSIAVLVTNIFTNCALSLTAQYFAQLRHHRRPGPRQITRIIPYGLVILLGLALNAKLVLDEAVRNEYPILSTNDWAQFTDLPCYAAGFWPFQQMTTALNLQMVPFGCLILIFVIIGIIAEGAEEPWKEGAFAFCAIPLFIAVTFATLLIWVDFALIISIRNRAFLAFGASYQDDTVGYGQILAIAPTVQVTFIYIERIGKHLLGESETKANALTAPLETTAKHNQQNQRLYRPYRIDPKWQRRRTL